MNHLKNRNRFFKYLLVGFLNNILNFFIFKALNFLNIQIFFSAAGGFLSGALVSYFLNSKFTFNTKKRSRVQFTMFLILQIFLLNIFSILLSLTNKFILKEENLSWCFATIIIIFINFTLQKKIFSY